MASLEKQAMIQTVYYPRGYFDHAENTVRYAKAPFDLIMIQDADDGSFDQYVIPMQSLWGHDLTVSIPAFETNHEREGIGYVVGSMMLEESGMGAWDNGSNEDGYTWQNLFMLGHV
jgi:hypothetical protein